MSLEGPLFERYGVREFLPRGMLPAAVEEACVGACGEFRARAAQVYLAALDESWTDHLLFVEEVREGIHLERLASRDPGLEYLHRTGDAFLEGLDRVEERTAGACRRARGDPGLLSAESMGTVRPSSTWTYQVDGESSAGPRLSAIGSAHVAAAIATAVVQVLAAVGRAPAALGRLVRGAGSRRRGGA